MDHQELADEVFGLSADALPAGCVEAIVTSLDLLKQSKVVWVVEGWIT